MVSNAGDGAVFFDQVQASTTTDDLISAQVDPSQPQVDGLSTVTNPVVPDHHISARLGAFDPEQFDLSPDSHLVRLLSAMLGAGGVGGVRRQAQISGMGSTLAGTNFLELDGFWGKLFSLPRNPDTEALPTNPDGTAFDASLVADSATWDAIAGRDGSYRSRIEQLAKGFASGATYQGFYLAATAILNSDVEIMESWTLADAVDPSTSVFTGNTWFAVENQYSTWGSLNGKSWGKIENLPTSSGDMPIGNRAEITIIPGRIITAAEEWMLNQVLSELAPAHCVVSISQTPFQAEIVVPPRDLEADSNQWSIVSLVNQQTSVSTGSIDLYPNASAVESARPAFGTYTGEKWAYNGRIASVVSYVIAEDGTQDTQLDYDTVTFADGSAQDYLPGDALADSRRVNMARAASDGVFTTYPYVEGRTT